MNALIDDNGTTASLKSEEELDQTTFGEVLAIGVLAALVALILIVSSWSMVSYLTGNVEGGGAIGFVYNLIRAAGVV